MLASTSITRREIQIARILRPLGQAPMRRAQAERAGQLLHVHWSTVYRLRRRLLRDPVTTSLVPNAAASRSRIACIARSRRWLPRRLSAGCRGSVNWHIRYWICVLAAWAGVAVPKARQLRPRDGCQPGARAQPEQAVEVHQPQTQLAGAPR